MCTHILLTGALLEIVPGDAWGPWLFTVWVCKGGPPGDNVVLGSFCPWCRYAAAPSRDQSLKPSTFLGSFNPEGPYGVFFVHCAAKW